MTGAPPFAAPRQAMDSISKRPPRAEDGHCPAHGHFDRWCEQLMAPKRGFANGIRIGPDPSEAIGPSPHIS